MSKDMDFTAGSHIREACKQVLAKAKRTNKDIAFKFNCYTLTCGPKTTLRQLHKQWKDLSWHPILSAKAEQAESRRNLKKIRDDQAAAIKKAKVATEAEMRDADVPWPKSMKELTGYVNTLVKRPHDYSTSAYAMSMAAVATFNYVAHELGTTGFQAGYAQMDFLRRERGMKHGFQILNYADLLYPQYLNDEHFPGWRALLAKAELRDELAKEARKLLKQSPDACDDVIAHWRWLSEGK